MNAPHLRVYYGPDDDTATAVLDQPQPRRTITIALGEVFPVLMDAIEARRAWVNDFDQDEITISEDLYDVIQAYKRFHRPSA